MPAKHSTLYLLLAILLCADATSFICEKIACTRATGEGIAYLLSAIRQPWMWLAWSVGPLQLWAWTRILKKHDLSLAYPISGLNILLTLPAATLILGESLSWRVWIGAILITTGGAIVGPTRAPKRIS